METKPKHLSRDPQGRRVPAGKTGAENRRRSTQPPRRPAENARRTENTNRRRENPARRQEPAVNRPRSAPQQTARPEQAAYIPQNVEEMVFQPEQTQRRTAAAKDPAASKRAEQRRRSAQRTKERQKQEKRRKNRPAVVYTQPKPINLNRLLLQIAVVLAVVLALTMGLSVFFKVENVVVYGNKAYSAWTIQEASGIEIGEKLMSINNARASGKIRTALPYVDTVRIGIKLPDTVNIYIEEIDVAYALQSQDGTWWLMTSGGKVTKQIDSGTASSYTKVLGVELDTPEIGEQAKAVEQVVTVSDATDAADATEETVPVTVTGAARLNAALQILDALEKNDIVGEVASVDVTSLNNIELWYGQRYQVKVGDTSQISTKIAWMKKTVAQMNDYQMGILDVSFTTWTDKVGFTPFE